MNQCTPIMPANRITTPVTTVPIRTRDSRIDSRKSRLKYKPARNSAPIPTRNARICKLELSASSAPGAFAVAPPRVRFFGRSLCNPSLIHGDTRLSQKMAAELSGERGNHPRPFSIGCIFFSNNLNRARHRAVYNGYLWTIPSARAYFPWNKNES